ncbi:MAG: sigma factor-like helix-turn-helix DNA-binding protein, partial [Acidimicrobiales bacterium]
VDSLGEPHRTVIRRRYGIDGEEPTPRYRLARELHMADRTVRTIEEEALRELALRRELDAIGEAA